MAAAAFNCRKCAHAATFVAILLSVSAQPSSSGTLQQSDRSNSEEATRSTVHIPPLASLRGGSTANAKFQAEPAFARPMEEKGGDLLVWDDLSVSLGSRMLLQPMHLELRRGSVLGVLGPSGAGKSTLLSALAGFASGGATLRGRVSPSMPSMANGDVALLAQDDSFFSMLTVRETLEMAAAMQPISRAETRSDRQSRVEGVISTLGLQNVRDSRIGGVMHRGISGGERRRLAVGVELLSSPSLLLADEPTTGLDAHGAANIMALLSRLSAERRVPAAVTLHQPRSSIWRALHDVLLLAPGGRVAYLGPRRNVLGYFEKLGYKCPPETNPAEFLIDLVSVNCESAAEAQKDRSRIDHICDSFRESDNKPTAAATTSATAAATTAAVAAAASSPPPRVSARRFPLRAPPLRRLCVVLRRAWRQNVRDGWVNGLRLGVSAGLALVLGEVFGHTTTLDAGSVAERITLLSYAAINMAMMGLMKTLSTLSAEAPVVGRERARKWYGACEYLFAKMVAEVPLDAAFSAGFGLLLKLRCGLAARSHALVGLLALNGACCAALGLAIGSAVPGGDAAMAAGIPIMVVHMVLGIINPAGQSSAKPPSKLLEAVANTSPIKWTVRGLCVADLRGAALSRSRLSNAPRMGALALVQSGDQVLERLGLESESASRCASSLGLLLAAELSVALVVQVLLRPRFQRMTPPKAEAAQAQE